MTAVRAAETEEEFYPRVFVAVLYHSKKGDVFSRMLQSLSELDYPPEKIVLCFIDNYSRDGAFELCSNWIDVNGGKYGGIIHLRAKGSVARLRNIALKTAIETRHEFLVFIESDVLADREFIRRQVSTLLDTSKQKNVISVSAVRDEVFENLDWLEKKYVKWLRRRSDRFYGLSEGEAFNSGNCIMSLRKVSEVGWFDEDVRFIEDLDWGRRATRKGFVCIFDSRVILPHLKKYSLRELRNYFMAGALSEAKIFLKNGLALKAIRRTFYWSTLFASLLMVWASPIPALILVAAGYVVYFGRARGLGKLLLYPVSTPFNILKSLGLGAAMLYWLIKGGYDKEKVTVLDKPDWEVVMTRLPTQSVPCEQTSSPIGNTSQE